jgi:hypothetical protein
MRRDLLSALLCLFAAPALAAGNFEFDVPAPPGLQLTISGYAADGTRTFSVPISGMQQRGGKSVYVTVVDEQIIFANHPARLCVSDPSGTWDALPPGKTELCDEHPSEVRGTYTFVPTVEQVASDAPAPLTTTLGCASDLLVAAGYLETDTRVGADEAVRRAAIRFSAVQARDPKLPKLEKGTLEAWCKRFAALPGSSIASLPPLLRMLNFGPDVSVGIARDTAAGLLEAAAYIETATGYRLGAAPAIFVSADPDWMTDAFVAETNLPPNRWPDRRAQFAACNGGEANYRMLFMCSKSRVFSEDWYGAGLKAQRAYALTHELFHVVQNEIVGRQPDACCDDAQWVARMGPVWLVEGSAEYVAFRLLADSGRMNLKKEMANQASNARKSKLTASQVESRAAFYGNGRAASVGMVAVENLLGTIGLQALPRYWLGLASDVTRQHAFEDAFGITRQSFYDAGDRRVAEEVTPKEMVACVQGELKQVGAYSGAIDGSLGPATRAAFAAYAKKHTGPELQGWMLKQPLDTGFVCLDLMDIPGLDDATAAIAERLTRQATFAMIFVADPAAVGSMALLDFGHNPVVETAILTRTARQKTSGQIFKTVRLPYTVARDSTQACMFATEGWSIRGGDGKRYRGSCDPIAPALGARELVMTYTVEHAPPS